MYSLKKGDASEITSKKSSLTFLQYREVGEKLDDMGRGGVKCKNRLIERLQKIKHL